MTASLAWLPLVYVSGQVAAPYISPSQGYTYRIKAPSRLVRHEQGLNSRKSTRPIYQDTSRSNNPISSPSISNLVAPTTIIKIKRKQNQNDIPNYSNNSSPVRSSVRPQSTTEKTHQAVLLRKYLVLGWNRIHGRLCLAEPGRQREASFAGPLEGS